MKYAPHLLAGFSLTLAALAGACSGLPDIPIVGGDTGVDASLAAGDAGDVLPPDDAGKDTGKPSMDASLDARPDTAVDAKADGPDAEVDSGPLPPLDLGTAGLNSRPPNGTCVAPLAGQEMPSTLAGTGCFNVADVTQPMAALIPFELNAALWSDNAKKLRWMVVPDGKKISRDAAGDFLFPEGTMLIKTFVLEGRRLETRFLVFHPEDTDNVVAAGWQGYAYQWNDLGDAADLLEIGGGDVIIPNVPGPNSTVQQWTIPVLTCMNCHNAAAGRAIGPEMMQLNRTTHYPATNKTAHQLVTLESIGMFEEPLGYNRDWPYLMPYADGDSQTLEAAEGTTEEHARSYVHVNCSFCHRDVEGKEGKGPEDFRATVSFEDMSACNVDGDSVSVDQTGFPVGAKLIKPKTPAESIMLIRMRDETQLGAFTPGAAENTRLRMPPSGSDIIDPLGVNIVTRWINTIEDCP